MRKLAHLFLSLGGAGFAPKAPGTVGSFVAAVILFVLFSIPETAIPIVQIVLFWVVYLLSLFLIKKFVQTPYDKSWIVIDEWLGMQLAFLPFLFFPMHPGWVLLAFLLFRFFDIRKPLWISTIDKKGTAVSVLNDDVLAGIYAALVLTVLIVSW